MADQVREVKQKADIVSIIGERVKLKKAGRNFMALCPFHSEKTPSFNVSQELGIFKCFGCGESGDVFSFLEKFEGMEFPEALRYVADKAGVKLEAFRPSREYAAREKMMAILSLAAEFYHYLLMTHKVGEEARQYLKQRGMWKKTIETFQLGYAPMSWEGLMKYLMGKKGYEGQDLEQLGLVIRKTKGGHYYDRFRGRIMFPLTNQRGQVVGFSGRLLEAQAKDSPEHKTTAEQGAKYINTPETTFYHKSELLYGLSVTKQAIKKEDKAIVTEGEFDVLSSWQGGVKNIVAIKGSALTEAQIRLLGRYSKNVSLALDADQAGEESTKRGIALADKLGMNVRVIQLVGGKDPDEVARAGKERWKRLVKRAVSVYDFYLSSTLRRYDSTTGEGKRQISRELAPILAGISSQVEQAHYIGKLAKALSVAEEVVGREVESVSLKTTEEKSEEVRPVAEVEKKEKVLVDEYVLGLILNSEGEILERVGKLETKWFQSLVVKRVVAILGEKKSRRFLQDGEWDIGGFVEELPAELQELTQRVWLANAATQSEAAAGREYSKAVSSLRQRYVRDRLKSFADKIEQLETRKRLTKKEEMSLKRFRTQFVQVSQGLKALSQ